MEAETSGSSRERAPKTFIVEKFFGEWRLLQVEKSRKECGGKDAREGLSRGEYGLMVIYLNEIQRKG